MGDTDSPRLSRLKCAKGEADVQWDLEQAGEDTLRCAVVVLRHPRAIPVPWSRSACTCASMPPQSKVLGTRDGLWALRLPAVGGLGSDLDSVKLSWKKKKLLSIPSLAACWAHTGTLSQREIRLQPEAPRKG